MTTSIGRAWTKFCLDQGISSDRLKEVIKEAYGASGDEGMIARLERGELDLDEFEAWMAAELSDGLDQPLEAAGIKDRLFAGVDTDERMVEAVRRAHDAGIKTGLISNSWGGTWYEPEELRDTFDAIVVSGQVRLRKPQPEIFLHAVKLLELEPADCVFVDDLEQNVEGARAVGMEGIVHRSADFTIPKLEDLLGVPLLASNDR